MPIELSAGAKHQLASLRSNLPEYLESDSHVALDATQKISSTELIFDSIIHRKPAGEGL